MPSWGELFTEVQNGLQTNPKIIDEIIIRSISKLHEYTRRNTIAYFSNSIKTNNQELK